MQIALTEKIQSNIGKIELFLIDFLSSPLAVIKT